MVDAYEEVDKVEAAEGDTYHGDSDGPLAYFFEVVFVKISMVCQMGLNLFHAAVINNKPILTVTGLFINNMTFIPTIS